MSITPELRVLARATYRLLFRVAANTFRGDDHVLNAFREKVRTEFREGHSITEALAYSARIQLGRDVADVLRKNVVQGVKVADTNTDGDAPSTSNAAGLQQSAGGGGGVWRLRLTKDTELGSNDSLKSRPNSSPTRSSPSPCCQSSASTVTATSTSTSTSTSTPSSSLPSASPSSASAVLDLFESVSECEEKEEEEYDAVREEEEYLIELMNRDEDDCLSESEASQQQQKASGGPFPNFSPEAESSSTNTNTNANDNQNQNQDQKAPKKLNYSTLKRLSQERVKPVLNEDDLEESFVRGSGPGGQSINKTANNVQLLHKPTGIRVKCQETRSLQTNRMIARRNLLEKLDKIANPGLSKEEMKRAKQVERERRRRRKAKKKKNAKAQAEEEED